MSQLIGSKVLITGSTSGIGFETAHRMLLAGATVILHGIDQTRVDHVAARLVKTGADPARIDTAVADFGRFDEVRAMASDVSDQHGGIDVLIANAGVAGSDVRRHLSVDGHELTFQVNYLSHYLLTRLLLGSIKASSLRRILVVSSTLHRTATLDLNDPDRDNGYSPLAAYAQSKLALTMFAAELANREPDVTVISVHPGVVETRLRGLYTSACGGPVETAAAMIRRLCARPVVRGAYYHQLEVGNRNPLVESAPARAKLWGLSEAMTRDTRFAARAAA
jgi:NAD(P)-dependent dehydrogenase (short-subunit alcohol dehydrogenase family)